MTHTLKIRAVPGAKADQVAGYHGDRLKIRVSAPPEGGKANKAICKVVAQHLGLKPRQVTVAAGHTCRDKTLTIEGIDGHTLADRLNPPEPTT
ncbi:MAG: DUF167 domain-containing protein [Planctomycetes bacterium]|nr:DUF167 domain-containing protein [Planctomycetota bacterium]NOG52963.1 DUF167 domain-containing protein [Planctomycetota bacterium]